MTTVRYMFRPELAECVVCPPDPMSVTGVCGHTTYLSFLTSMLTARGEVDQTKTTLMVAHYISGLEISVDQSNPVKFFY
jgi:hypothetical protein